MTQTNPITPKPISEAVRPEITRLPELTPWRRFVRRVLRGLLRLLTWLFLDLQTSGLENVPSHGPALVVSNHIGDADALVGIAWGPRIPEVIAKAELYDLPVLGKVLDAFGMIWIHRGQPDRRALRAALQGLAEGRLVSVAPEGRESLTGGLEEGTNGAAYLAIKANVPILPVTFTGTDNSLILGNMKRLRRTPVTFTIGPLFQLPAGDIRRKAIQDGTQLIMQSLAKQLPPEYRGVYQLEVETPHGGG